MSGKAGMVYECVKETRKGLLAYCASLPQEVYTRESEDFGWGSIRNTLIHAADCYRYWLAEAALGEPVGAFQAKDHPDAAGAARLFETVDGIVVAFIGRFPAERLDEAFGRKVNWQPEPLVVTPRWLLAHTITHEFHHKGQIVAMGRILGFPAPETDLYLPELV